MRRRQEKKPKLAIALAALSIGVKPFATAQGWDPDTTFPALSPEESIATIEVPDGYRLECIASEPMVQEPVSFTFDGNGALYVCEWNTYMLDEFGTGQLEPTSRVVKLVDSDGDGRMDQRTVFIDSEILPRAVLPLHDRVLVTLTQDKSVWAFFDDDRDGVADRKEIAYYRDGQHGNIEHQHSAILWNLDNTVCTNDHRFHFDRSTGKLTSQKHGLWRISQWGLARDDDGRLFGSWAGRGNPVAGFQLPAGYPILPVSEHGPDFGKPFGICKVWDETTGGYDTERQAVLRHFSAPCGQEVMRGDLMPEFYGRVVTCEPAGRFVRMSSIEWKDGLGVAHNAFTGSEFIRSKDAYFRPVWTGLAPDGSLVIADMYRGIIQEKDYFATTGDAGRVARYHRVKKWGMIDVTGNGRLYRLVPEGKQKAAPRPRMLDETPTELVRHLAHTNGWWRDSAQKLIVCRDGQSAVPALEQMAREHDDVNARIHAMWALRGLESLDPAIVFANLGHPEPRVRRAAVQLAEPILVEGDEKAAAALGALGSDPDPHVAIQLYLAYTAADVWVPKAIANREGPIIDALKQRQAEIDAQKAALSASAANGQQVFETNCAACHGADGKGVKQGELFLAPSFETSTWFKNGGKAGILARILLKGEAGPIDGVTYGQGMMQPLEEVYGDQPLADVLNFIGERWHGWSKPIPASKIDQVRREFADRTTPFTHDELVELARKGGGK